MERLKGKSVLITGASSGIGQAIAIRFAAQAPAAARAAPGAPMLAASSA